MKHLKSALYFLACLGLIDMALQALTEGKIKVIQSILGLIFTIIILVPVGVSGQSSSSQNTSTQTVKIGIDKLYHFAVGFGLTGQLRAVGVSEKRTGQVVFGLALGKEIFDAATYKKKRPFLEHALDLGFTIAGYGVSSVLIQLLTVPKDQRGIDALYNEEPAIIIEPADNGFGLKLRF